MTEKQIQFLKEDEALIQIADDLIGSDPTWHNRALFARVDGFISGETVRPGTCKEPGTGFEEPGIWRQKEESGEEAFFNYSGFKELLADCLPKLKGRMRELAKVYQWIYWVKAVPGAGADGEAGIFVETEMEKFKCVRCGNCCLNLSDAFQTSVDMDVIRRWEEEGRWDILDYVEIFEADGEELFADIWFSPVTGQDVSRCPWLRKLPNKDIYKCRIHETKPPHCANYPKSKKHALTTGCKGFGDDSTFDTVCAELERIFKCG